MEANDPKYPEGGGSASPGSTMEISVTEGQQNEGEKEIQSQDIDEDPYAKPEGNTFIKIEIEEKESFASKIAYLLILIGNAVGFGNIWRFPYLIQQNGGVIFLVPYCCMLAFLGIPMFFLELAIGQRLHKSCLKSWNEISHYLGGVGFACGMICLVIGFYYITLISWCVRYTFSVFGERLPWHDCQEAEITCRDPYWKHISAENLSRMNGTYADNMTREQYHCNECEKVGPSTHFWYNNVLNISENITTLGSFNVGIAICLFVAWFVVWAILVKGLRSTGKVVYFTALFPYFVLICFFIRGLLLENMSYGYAVAFTPKWEKLADVQVWFTAGTQIFFSLGLGFGLLVSFSALNPAKNNCYKDAILVSLINCSTSLFASMVIFPILGHKGSRDFEICAKEAKANILEFNTTYRNCTYVKKPDEEMEILKMCFTNETLNAIANQSTILNQNTTLNQSTPLHNGDLTGLNETHGGIVETACSRSQKISDSAQGTGLVFIVFTEAMNSFGPTAQLWAFMFFLMLLTLGIGSGFTTVEGIVVTLHELNLFNWKIKKWKITTAVCSILCCCSMVFAFGFGNYLLTFLDEFTANWTLLIAAFFECIGVAWIYGLKQFSYDIKLMTGKAPNIYLLICWRFISPFVMVTLLILSFVNYSTKDAFMYSAWDHKLGKTVQIKYPIHVIAIGFCLTFLVIGSIPLFAILAKFKIYVLKPEEPAHFPEEELRADWNVTEADDIAPESNLEKVLFWGSSQDLYRRRSSTVSAMAFNMGLPQTAGPHHHQDHQDNPDHHQDEGEPSPHYADSQNSSVVP